MSIIDETKPWQDVWGDGYCDMDAEKLAFLCLNNAIGREILDGGQNVPRIHNVVSTSHIVCLCGSIDLRKISFLLPNSSYDRRIFAAITIRTLSPFATSLLFSSGKLVITGVKSFYESVYASLRVIALLNRVYGYRAYAVDSCVIQNIVAHTSISMGPNEFLNIHEIYERWQVICTYQKSMFPGLIVRNDNSPTVCLCFYSGKIVLTGAKNMEDVITGWKYITKFCSPYVEIQKSIDNT